jgi:tellurite resistance protein
MSLHPEMDLTEAQAEIFARGLYAVARAEGGVKPEEAGLIKSFFGEVAGGKSLSSLAQGPDITADAVALGLGKGDAGKSFLKTCILLSYADGNYHPKEREVIDTFAKALGVQKPELDAMEQSVKEYLLSSLSHLHNVEATTEVAKKLNV